jgi:hypothetical protein
VKIGSLAVGIALAAGVLAAAQSPAQPPPQTPTPAAPGQATVPPLAGQAPAPAPAVPASRKFTSDAGVIFSKIRPEKAADFEAVMVRVKEALAKSQDPKRKQQALSWRVLKGLEAGPGGNVVYIWLLDPAVKDEDYSITGILAEAFPNEAQDLWAKYTACFVDGQTMLNLQQVLNMSPALVPK